MFSIKLEAAAPGSPTKAPALPFTLGVAIVFGIALRYGFSNVQDRDMQLASDRTATAVGPQMTVLLIMGRYQEVRISTATR
jgi:hypothetical protein